jgi:hypothetical protein
MVHGRALALCPLRDGMASVPDRAGLCSIAYGWARVNADSPEGNRRGHEALRRAGPEEPEHGRARRAGPEEPEHGRARRSFGVGSAQPSRRGPAAHPGSGDRCPGRSRNGPRCRRTGPASPGRTYPGTPQHVQDRAQDILLHARSVGQGPCPDRPPVLYLSQGSLQPGQRTRGRDRVCQAGTGARRSTRPEPMTGTLHTCVIAVGCQESCKRVESGMPLRIGEAVRQFMQGNVTAV